MIFYRTLPRQRRIALILLEDGRVLCAEGKDCCHEELVRRHCVRDTEVAYYRSSFARANLLLRCSWEEFVVAGDQAECILEVREAPAWFVGREDEFRLAAMSVVRAKYRPPACPLCDMRSASCVVVNAANKVIAGCCEECRPRASWHRWEPANVAR